MSSATSYFSTRIICRCRDDQQLLATDNLPASKLDLLAPLLEAFFAMKMQSHMKKEAHRCLVAEL